MIKEHIQVDNKLLLELIIKGIQDKKGLSIVCIDLTKIKNTICDCFVICHGTSNIHVSSISDSIEETVTNITGIKPGRKEGITNSEWIILDYLDIVVHVFQQHIREYYKLEDLWADAPFTAIDECSNISN